MFYNLKILIHEFAQTAVIEAEKLLESQAGKEKKAFAINFIVDNLPVPSFLRGVIKIVFSKVIDECIEFAVLKIKETSGS